MGIFADCLGREWLVDVTIGTVQRIKKRLAFDLLNLTDDDLHQLMTDPLLLCDVLWFAIEDEAKERGITPRGFGRALAGDVIEAAAAALLDALADFFPKADAEADEDDDQHQQTPTVDRWDLVWELAGVVGADPTELTFRELSKMAEARFKNEWNQTSHVMALIANCHRDAKRQRRPYKPRDFNPLMKQRAPENTTVMGKGFARKCFEALSLR